MDKVRGRLLDC